MIADFILLCLGVVIIIFVFYFLLETYEITEEKRQRYRDGITDYYDEPIKKEKDE